MNITPRVREILSWYASDNPGIHTNLARLLMHGKLAGTGKMIILPVDQGFEHGPVRSFAMNREAYDPCYHYKLAIDAGLNGYAAPLGMLEAGAYAHAGDIPTILKINSGNSLYPADLEPMQAVTGSVQDALRLGCAAIGLTIYPGSATSYIMIEQARALIAEARAVGLPTIIWAYPRGAGCSKTGETAVDVCAYVSHMCALLGAHIIKVKLPTAEVECKIAAAEYKKQQVDVSTATARVAHVKEATFAGKRLVIFSGGAKKSDEDVIADNQAIMDGGGDGAIIGRNAFQRPRAEAMKLLETLTATYLG